MNERLKGRFTIRTAGIVFFLSAACEVISMTSAVPLFGAIRSGSVAAAYHLFYTGLFAAIGVGLWVPKKWGIKAAFCGALFYSADKFLFLLDRAAMESYLLQIIADPSEIFQVIGMQSLFQIITLMYILFILGWWGFVGYLYLRRQYFTVP